MLSPGLSDNLYVDEINLQDGSRDTQKIHKLMVERYLNGGGNVPHLNMDMRDEGVILLVSFVIMESVVR